MRSKEQWTKYETCADHAPLCWQMNGDVRIALHASGTCPVACNCRSRRRKRDH